MVNYKQTINEFANNPNLPNCNCHNSSNYIYQPSGHVITGNLNFINNKKLKSIFNKGPNFRVSSKMDFDGCSSEFREQLDKLITKWAKKEKSPQKIFFKYKERVLNIFNPAMPTLVFMKKCIIFNG